MKELLKLHFNTYPHIVVRTHTSGNACQQPASGSRDTARPVLVSPLLRPAAVPQIAVDPLALDSRGALLTCVSSHEDQELDQELRGGKKEHCGWPGPGWTLQPTNKSKIPEAGSLQFGVRSGIIPEFV